MPVFGSPTHEEGFTRVEHEILVLGSLTLEPWSIKAGSGTSMIVPRSLITRLRSSVTRLGSIEARPRIIGI